MSTSLAWQVTPEITFLLQVLQKGDKVAVIGDGKLGLLVAQILVLQGHTVAHFGKHKHKLSLVSGTQHTLVTEQTAEHHAAVRHSRCSLVTSFENYKVAQPTGLVGRSLVRV